jgi:hypothetical protein
MNAHPRIGTLSETELAAARIDIAAQSRDTDTVPVTFTVTDLRRLHSAGSLLALATVAIDANGVEILLSGVQVLRLPNGRLQARSPRYRAQSGEWLPAVTLPEELERAIGREVLAMVTEP